MLLMLGADVDTAVAAYAVAAYANAAYAVAAYADAADAVSACADAEGDFSP